MTFDSKVDVQTFLNEQPFSAFQWLVFVLCFLVVLLDGFDTAAIGYIAPSLIKEWGIARPALAPVLSAALFGLAFGAFAAGPLSDRLGRRPLLCASVLIMGAACLASAYSPDLQTLTVLRFLTGLGLGAALPNAVTLMSEYCPESRRATLTNLMVCGFPLGAAFGGFLSAWMIPQFGWRSALLLGGIAPLLLVVAMWFALPESVRYLVAKRRPSEQIRAVLRRISAAAAAPGSFVLNERVAHGTPSATSRSGLALVLSTPYLIGSLMLWVVNFMGLVIFYALVNWMPVLFKDAGIDPKTATLIAALFPLGGCGAIVFGVLMDKFNPNRTIAAGYALTAGAVFLIGQTVGNVGLLMVIVFIAGILMNTAQSSTPALAAQFYPTQGRATGVGWMLGMGRFGGIAGSFLVAELTAHQFTLAQTFAVVAVAGAIAALALLVKQAVHPEAVGRYGADREGLAH